MKLEFLGSLHYPDWVLYDDYVMIKGQKVLLSKIKEVKILKKQPDFFGPGCIFLVDFNYNTHSLYISNKDKNKWETAKDYIFQNYGGKKLQERQQAREQELRNKAAMANAGMQVMMDVSNIKNGGTSTYVSASQQKNETKEIVKGAVVGGIVAGNAGAVVGAIAAKNKIDNKKK